MAKKPAASSIIPISRTFVEAADIKEGDAYQVFKWKGEYYLTPANTPPEVQKAKLDAMLSKAEAASGQRKNYRDVDEMLRDLGANLP